MHPQRDVSGVAVADEENLEKKKLSREVWKMESGVPSGAARSGVGANGLDNRMRVFSHLMSQVIHWSTCASARFFCPCF